MKHIDAAFDALNNRLQLQSSSYVTCGQLTVLDIVLYNEINQILYLYELYVNGSTTCVQKRKECVDGNF